MINIKLEYGTTHQTTGEYIEEMSKQENVCVAKIRARRKMLKTVKWYLNNIKSEAQEYTLYLSLAYISLKHRLEKSKR